MKWKPEIGDLVKLEYSDGRKKRHSVSGVYQGCFLKGQYAERVYTPTGGVDIYLAQVIEFKPLVFIPE